MFEGLVQKLLLDYLGRYVKGIQKEQLKIGLWNGEVLLENVDLVLEAFDYLQLPLALKQGRVGRLSIKIPWKKLGWDPIIIALEDVFVCVSQRDDHEWSMDLVERREFAGKKAKLAAAELAKLSRRVCDNQAGQSFISYITAKILDGIQVSIRNVHILYSEKERNLEQFVFGVRFSSLMIMKHNLLGPDGKYRGSQVNKIVEISRLGIYCSIFDGRFNRGIDCVGASQFYNDVALGRNELDYILTPFDIAISLVVNRSGRLESGAPQYSISADLTDLVLVLNELQMQQFLTLWDYLSTSELREKYGRYRPWCNLMSRKLGGWQRMWWHYAQESVLSDVRRQLRKSSWRYLGWRISYRRKYVNLYKKKLDFLREEQAVDKDSLQELEQMEKESDLDDILSYRSIAEHESETFHSASPEIKTNGGKVNVDRQKNDDRSSLRSRGWLNWLSLGMLGAGGTEDSVQFSGIVSDEVIQDIYEVMEFHPDASLDGGVPTKERNYMSSFKFNIHQISATLWSKTCDKEIVQVTCTEVVVECKLWEESWVTYAMLNSMNIVEAYTNKVILYSRRSLIEESSLNSVKPFITIQVDSSPINHDSEFLLKVVVQPFEVTYNPEFVLNLLDFRCVLSSFQFQHERVLLALNSFKNDDARLLSKTEYICSNRKNVILDLRFSVVTLRLPWKNKDSESFVMIIDIGALLVKSKVKTESPALDTAIGHDSLYAEFQSSAPTYGMPFKIQLQDLYAEFDILLTEFEVNVMESNCSETLSVLERFSGSITLSSCIIPHETVLKQLKVDFSLTSLRIHFSPQIYAVTVGVITSMGIPTSKPDEVVQGRPKNYDVFHFSVAGNMESVSFHARVADDAETSLVLILALGGINIQYSVEEEIEYWVGMKMLKISACSSKGGTSTLCMSRNFIALNEYQYDTGPGIDRTSCDLADECFLLHYQTQRSAGMVYHKYSISFHDVDLHIDPNIFGPLLQFYDTLSGYGNSSPDRSRNTCGFSKEIDDKILLSCSDHKNFGFSNYIEARFIGLGSIPLDHFPFVTIHNSGSLSSLEASLIHGSLGWRKKFIVRDRKFSRSPKSNLRKRSKMFSSKTKKFPPSNDVFLICESCSEVDFFVIDLNISGIRVHFHDSSCILGLLTLPILKSYVVVDGTNSMDLLCSVEGLYLTSSWSACNYEFLWGPSVSNPSNILNIRLRTKIGGSSSPQIELSISVQHVCCVLPSEYLAILIGYFSLPDWTLGQNKQHVNESNDFNILYKFEVLDSILILPLESNNHRSLHLKLPQLYCSFTAVNHLDDALKDIPSECLVPPHKVADKENLLNMFGLDLSLSAVFLKNEDVDGKNDNDRNISLIVAMDADLWLRLPCESKSFNGTSTPTCIMTRIQNCHVIAEDEDIFCGVEAVLEVINHMSSVGRESEAFTYDVLQFLQLKRSLKEGNIVSPDVPSATLTEVSCSVNSMTILLYRSGKHSSSSEKVAKADMQLKFSALFRDEIPMCMDIEFSGLTIYSFRTSVSLVDSFSDGSGFSPLDFHFSKSERGESTILVGLVSLHIWLHLSEWSEVIELFSLYSTQFSKLSFMSESPKGSTSCSIEFESDPETPSVSNSTDTVDFNVKLENIAVWFYIPIVANEEAFCKSKGAEDQEELPWDIYSHVLVDKTMLKTKYCKYVLVTLISRDTEIDISGTHAKLKTNLEKIRGTLENFENEKTLSLPFFQIVHVNALLQLYDKDQGQHLMAKIQVETVDVWLSHQIFYFWHGFRFEVTEAGSSQFPFSSIVLEVQSRKVSLLLTDGRWSWNGPLLEILVRNLLLHAYLTESTMEATVGGDYLVNYNNIHKVMWEPFIEPWSFQAEMIRKSKFSAPLNSYVLTDVSLKSTAQLNLNVTEPLIEIMFRANELIKDMWGQAAADDLPASWRFLGPVDNVYSRRYAPYTLLNETSLPLLFQVYRGFVNVDDYDIPVLEEGNIVQPGSSVPIYVYETPEEEVFRFRPPQSSDNLNEKKSNGVAHYMISIELDGTSGPSIPISMDIVGLSYFEVNFSKASEKLEVNKDEDASKYSRKFQEKSIDDSKRGYVVPVVFDVSIQRYTKLIRLYSTVILLNATSVPLELRFDIPFGVSPKVLGPIHPGQEFALPVHLAEAGRMRWRPLGDSFLWSEAHMLSNLLSQENRIGFLRSFVCYPSHPSSDPFRCCISVQHIHFPSSSLINLERSEKCLIHYVTLTTPLMVRNYLPSKESFVTVESGGVSRSIILPEVERVSVLHIDSTHDLGITFNINGFKPSSSKFSRVETFTTTARFNDGKFFSSETLALYPDSSKGPIYVTLEKVMDASCGAREISISVPFLLYNCTGLPLTVVDSGNEVDGKKFCTVVSCYSLFGSEQLLARKHGLGLVSAEQKLSASPFGIHNLSNSFANHNPISVQDSFNLYSSRSLSNLNRVCTSNQLCFSDKGVKDSKILENDNRKAIACMYSPHPSSSSSELMVRLNMCLPEHISDNFTSSSWSRPFFLVPASGSASVVVPKAHTSGAFILSVTSSPIIGPFSGTTRAVSFQPRYVISNACSKDLCYKQKGTDSVLLLGTGQHSHLHWDDTTRELLVSLRFNEPGWLWSGSFFPDHLGDTQVKMRNYVCDSLNMIRVEVQNADVSIRGEKVVGSAHGNSGTNLILLSDDTSGFMPYRIDNFSKERLRIYQKSCETCETIVHSYTSCPYAWDEPCYPHRLVIEVPGQRVLGSYCLDEVMEQVPANLPSTSEKPGRRLFVSIHAEGAVKVLSIIDSSCHIVKDITETGFRGLKDKKKPYQKHDVTAEYSERISVHISFVGISLINSNPQELLFASAKDIKIDVLQNLEQQKLSFKMSSLQIDNQLRNATYPVILHFDPESGSNSAMQIRNKDGSSRIKNKTAENSCEPVFSFSAAKWRNKEISPVSFEYISLRLADLCLELEEEVILSLLHLVRVVILRIENRTSFVDSAPPPVAQEYESANLSRSKLYSRNASNSVKGIEKSPSMPSVLPIGAPWQKIYLLARRQKKIYVEVLDLAPIKLTLSFSSAPWVNRTGGAASTESLAHVNGTAFQRGLMAFADVEGAPVYLKQLSIAHYMGSFESYQEILFRHYTRQLLHETYKVFGSAGVIGNPMGFARNLGLGIKDFLSVPARGMFQSPVGLITGMAQGTTSLFANTVYAVSNATTQFSKSAHKSIVAFTFEDQATYKLDKQHNSSHSNGVLNEFLEGLTGFLQSPIRGAEKHGLPGVFSGIALGTAGLVARPVASILEVTGKTAQSIRNRSSLHRPHHFRVRFPRPLNRETPLHPYSWEEAVGTSVLLEADNGKFKDETFVMCKALKKAGKFVTLTESLILVVTCPSLVGLGSPEFRGVSSDPEWTIEIEMGLECIIHVGKEEEVLNIVGTSSETLLKQQNKRGITSRTKWFSHSTSPPLFHTSMEFPSKDEAEDVLQVLLSTVEQGKERGLGVHVLHRRNLR